MKIDGLVVSVNYSSELLQGIGAWSDGLDSLMVVTDYRDEDTAAVALNAGAYVFRTDTFYLDGAAFNKGRALEEARKELNAREWLLIFDADIIPPDNWRQDLMAAHPERGWLYGAWRYIDGGAKANDDTHGYGYFQLFHTQDPLAQADPLFSTDWSHAGNYDSDLMLRWRDAGRLAPPLPLRLTHQGPIDHNWWGKGQHERFREMERERARRGGGWDGIQHERLSAR